MDSELKQVSRSAYAVIGPEGSTNFSIVKGGDGSAVLIDADIRRIDEVEEALELTGCSKVCYLIDTHEHFDHTSANFYFAQRGISIVASAGTVGGAYASFGKTRMVQRNINHYLTGRWF